MHLLFLSPSELTLLAGAAIPLLVHLLVRRHARRMPFPSLQFVPGAESRAARLRHLSDPGLMLLRTALVALAVLAVARPLLVTPARQSAWTSRVSRVIVVDVSASAAAAARAAVAREANGTARAVVIETRALARTVDRLQLVVSAFPPSRHELVIVSDFQEGAADGVDLRNLPEHVGVRLVPVAAGRPAAPPPPALPLVRVSASEETAARHALDAVAHVTGLRRSPAARVVVVRPDTEDFKRAAASLAAPSRPWMADLVARVRADHHLREAATSIQPDIPPERAFGSPWVPFARSSERAIAWAARSGDQLIVSTSVSPDTFAFPALLLSLARASIDERDMREAVLPLRRTEELPLSERSAGGVPSASIANAQDDDASWWWMAAGVLMLAETRVRRARRSAAQSGEARAA